MKDFTFIYVIFYIARIGKRRNMLRHLITDHDEKSQLILDKYI